MSVLLYKINVNAIKTPTAFIANLEENDLRIYIDLLKTPNSQSNPEQKGNVEDILTLDLDYITELW